MTSSPAPKVIQGDKRAVVGMLFRSRKHAVTTPPPSTTEQRTTPVPPKVIEPPRPGTSMRPTSEEDGDVAELSKPPVDNLVVKNNTDHQREGTTTVPTEMLQLRDAENLEVFFILRAPNEKDRWSFQVGFPGGRREKDETEDEEVVAREVFEEVGLILPGLNRVKFPTQAALGERYFKRIGRVHDRVVLQNKTTLSVGCLVFFQVCEETPPLTLASREVAAGGWVPVSFLARDDCMSPVKMRLDNNVVAKNLSFPLAVARALNLRALMFTKVDLPVSELILPPASSIDEEAIRKNFYVWGLTLGMLNDALYEFARLRKRPIQLSSPSLPLGLGQVDYIFNSYPHNLALAAFRRVSRVIVGRELMWSEFVRYYLVLLTAATVGLPIAALWSSRNKASRL